MTEFKIKSNVGQIIFRLRKDFKRMLEEMGCVTPGKSLNELRVLFLGRECFENLPENEVQEIYDLHQRELIQRSKKNFQVSIFHKVLMRLMSLTRISLVISSFTIFVNFTGIASGKSRLVLPFPFRSCWSCHTRRYPRYFRFITRRFKVITFLKIFLVI